MITPNDVATILLFVIPGYISIKICNYVGGYNTPKEKFDKIIVYIMHSFASILIYTFLVFLFTKQINTLNLNNYVINDFVLVLLISPFWGSLYGFITKVADEKGLLPHGIVMSNNMFRKFHREWFKGRPVRIKLKSGDLYKGWLCTYEEDFENNTHYIGLADVSKINSEYKVIKKLGYSIMVINIENLETIEYYSSKFKDYIKSYKK